MLDIQDIRIYESKIHSEKEIWKPHTAKIMDFEDIRIFEIGL